MSVARSYARALFEVSQTRDTSLDQITAELHLVWGYMNSSKEARVAFLSPAIAAKDKVMAIQEVSRRAGFSPLVAYFLQLLGKKERLSFLPEIQKAFNQVRLEAEGAVEGQLVSADPMEAKDIEDLARAFSKKLGKKVVFRAMIDPTLLAGIKVTVNGVNYDGTLRSQLQRLREKLEVPSVQLMTDQSLAE